MKKTFLSAAWLLLAASYPLSAQEKIDSDDPCTVVLCMYGKLQGNNQSECNGAVRKFFHLKNLVGMVFVHGKLLLNGEIFLADVQQQIRLLSATS
ncbi:hypothetical protein [Arsenophonus apicola]|uniref:hypothetical protein n=1 Tax=Arsenophonus apicola TaxID=2879119 RepID=UPI001CDC4AE5|nr:hypothetical protein [Arsenophonus apicola]UBX30739.1 hypothetical protein LDL57_16355 [Arsenophonus apicola]